MSPGSTLTFGDLLRQHRVTAGLTQQALAERAGLSVQGIQKLERGATHPYRDTAQRLVVALQLESEDESRFRAAVLPVRRSGTVRPLAIDRSARHNLPGSISSFVGRELEVAEVTRRLANTRLLTLTGIGGCGKTRLALEVARGALESFPQGVWLVELGPLSDPALVTHQVGAVLGVSATSEQPFARSLANVLMGRHLLLVLDNCEHLLEACAVLADSLLRTCPELHILATSREPIGVDGEVAWRVPSLLLPEQDHTSLADLEHNPAVQLFVERAIATQPRFALTVRNAPAVAHICRRLDGIPLALELAAARVDALTAEQLVNRLDHRFRLLTGGSRAALPRHQTLVATLDWSYALLSTRERRLFERLAVFAGGWSLEAAEAVGAGKGVRPEEVIDVLSGLVRKSLVVATDAIDGSEHYTLLETVRDYARQKLAACRVAEIAAARGRHAAFYLAQAAQVGPSWAITVPSGDALVTPVLDRLVAMHDNLRAALSWWLEAGRAAEGLELFVVLADSWQWHGRYAEGQLWLRPMLELADRTMEQVTAAQPGTDTVAPSALRARALGVGGMLASRMGSYARARSFHEATLQLWRELGDPVEIAHAQSWIGLHLWCEGDLERASAILNESLRDSRAIGTEAGGTTAQTLRNLGMVARSRAQYEHAATLFREAMAHARAGGWYRGYTYTRAMAHLGRVVSLQGDYEQGAETLREALQLIHESDQGGQNLADCLDWLAAVAGAHGHPVRAVRLFGAADVQWRVSGGVRYAPDRPAYESDVTLVRARLDEHDFSAAWAEGQAMGTQQAIAYALGEDRTDQKRSMLAPQSRLHHEASDGGCPAHQEAPERPSNGQTRELGPATAMP